MNLSFELLDDDTQAAGLPTGQAKDIKFRWYTNPDSLEHENGPLFASNNLGALLTDDEAGTQRAQPRLHAKSKERGQLMRFSVNTQCIGSCW